MDDEWIYGGRLEQIHQTLVEGRPNGMPAWGGKIPDEQLWQIAAYVRSMSLPQTLAAQNGATPSQSPGAGAARGGADAGWSPPLRPRTTTRPPRQRVPRCAACAPPCWSFWWRLPGGARGGAGGVRGPEQPAVLQSSASGLREQAGALLARQLQRDVRYEWWAQRRGFARHTLATPAATCGPGSRPACIAWRLDPVLPVNLRVRHP